MGNIFSFSLSCDRVINRCGDCFAGQAEFVCKLEENVEALITELAELKDLRNDVVRKVKIAEDDPQLNVLYQVQGWLSRAETLINGADLLIEKSPQEMKKLCLGGCCSMNPKSNLKFGKQIAKMLPDVVDHKSKGVFERVAEEVPRPLVTERPSEPAVGLESTFNEAWKILEGEQVGIIGLYGMAGVGKTTLMNQLNNKFSEPPKRFNVVIWIVVSKAFSIGKVQDKIAKWIGITNATWQDKTKDDKALDISMVLKEKKFVILLDDIWERIDLADVGIPVPTKENGSKLVFTTRSVEVCGKMEAHKKIQVKCLPQDKAWELFQEKVGEETLNTNPYIRELAQELAKECRGLPLALVTIARAMACNTSVEEWRYAIKTCKSSPTSVFPDMDEKVYPLLKFSYDSLRNNMYRICLLYCSLFSEDYNIGKDKLVDLWIGEGFLDEHGQGHHIIGSLVRACLLEEVDEFWIKMHDVVRNMCLWIARECEEEKWKLRSFVQAGCGLTMLPEVGKWKSTHRMSLMDNRIVNLVEPPNCPHLQTLFLNRNWLKVISNDFFQFMTGLKVLDLSDNSMIEELPVGISKLVSLEYLDLSDTGIRRLPIEMKTLKRLKCLNLECFTHHIRIPRQLISALLKLQVLRIRGCYYLEQEVEDNSESLVEELKCLNHLNVFTVTLTNALGLDRFLSDERECNSLEEVKMEWGGENRTIKAESHIHIQIATQHCFQSLRNVLIWGCSKLMDVTFLILAPNLRFFNAIGCDNMEEIINERKVSQVVEQVETLSLFAKLQCIGLRYLPELKSIYWDTLPFSCLKEIYVSGCPKLKRLPVNSNSAKDNKISIEGHEGWWKELQWDDESTLNHFLPCFKPF